MESSAIYGLESQGRSLCSSSSNDLECIRFYAACLSPRAEGQIHQVDFDDETNKISRKIYKPKVGEIWQIQVSPSTSARNLVGLCYNHITESSCQMKASIFSLPDEQGENGEDPSSDVKQVVKNFEDKENPGGNVVNLDWHPSRGEVLATVFDNKFIIWDIDHGHGSAKVNSSWSHSKMDYGKWNPQLDGNQFAIINGTSVSGIDIRSMSISWTLPKANKFQVKDFDFNPNKQFYIGTCGEDCSAKFWDFRKSTEPVKSINYCHSHWIWRIRFNPFHDQLVLTSGSDSRVLLHSLPSISSEPRGRSRILSESEDDLDEKNQNLKDKEIPTLEEGILAKYEQHEDAVYATEWSSVDPWIFSSLSYDGRLIINRVSKSQKYKILL